MPAARVLVFGATSMVGSHFAANGGPVAAAGRRDPAAEGTPIARFEPVDLANPDEVERVTRESPEPCIVNFAARTDVDPCETERPPPGEAPQGGRAWAVNAEAPAAMARGARAAGKYFVQISTDFVFDGRSGPYDEAAPRSTYSPLVSWYGWTKSEGELKVLETDPGSAVLRIGFPYRPRFPGKLDFARWLLDRADRATLPPLYTDQQITPTWVPDVTRGLTRLLERRTPGIFHLGSPEPVVIYEFAAELFRQRGGPFPELRQSRLQDVPPAAGRAPRPIHGGLKTTRFPQLGVSPTSWRAGIGLLLAAEGGA